MHVNKKQKYIPTDKFNTTLRNLSNNKARVFIVTVGSKKQLWIRSKFEIKNQKGQPTGKFNKLICASIAGNQQRSMPISDIKSKNIKLFLARFTKEINARIRDESLNLHNLNIIYKGPMAQKNEAFWENIHSQHWLYHIDLLSAYWQMLHQNGYISDKFYLDYINKDKYKHLKRLCVTLKNRSANAYYPYLDNWSISCNNDMYKQMYDNIRNNIGIIMAGAIKACNNEYIAYATDGIFVLAPQVDNIKKYFKSLNLAYKTTLCLKNSENTFTFNNKIRYFKKTIVKPSVKQ